MSTTVANRGREQASNLQSTDSQAWCGGVMRRASACLAGLLFAWAGSVNAAAPPVPEILHYRFDEAGTTVTNHASAPPTGAATGTVLGGLTQNSVISGTHLKAVVGTGNLSSTDYVDTGWATNLPGSWSISFFTSNIANSTTTRYILGDINAGQLRIFSGGVAGTGNWILRGAFTDVFVIGGAVTGTTMSTFVYDSVANEIRSYLNGVLNSTVAQASVPINGAGPFKVGGYATSNGLPNGGLLGDVRIYSKALTAAEITDIYNAATELPQTLSFATAPSVVAGGSASVVATSATPNSGNPITYSTTSADCSVTSAGVVTGINAGTNNCTIEAQQAGVIPVPSFLDGAASLVLSIGRVSQTIAFTSTVPSAAKVGQTYTATAIGGSSGKPVTFSIDASAASVCSVLGSDVTFNSAGACVINANQLGNANYEAAAQVQQTVNVGQAGSGVTVSSTPNPSQPGGAVIFNVSVAFDATKAAGTSTLKAAPVPTGTVTVTDGTTTLGTAALVNGGATLTVNTLTTPGAHSITVAYSGDANYPATASAAFVQTVSAATTTGTATPVPTLHHAALALLSLMAAGFGALAMRSRKASGA